MSGASVTQGVPVVAGEAHGPVIVLDVPLSLWGGYDPVTGTIIDEHHPQVGAVLTGAVVVMASGRGSSSASSVLVESARLGTLPVAFVVRYADEILTTGAIVADELYGRPSPIVVVDDDAYAAVAASSAASIAADGSITLLS